MTNKNDAEAPAAKTPKTPKTPRKQALTIRNLRGTVVHLRLYSENPKDPYRIELRPRGTQGDWTTIPAKLTDDPTFTMAVGVLVEVIPLTEAKALSGGYAPVGYLGRTDAPVVITAADSTVSTADNWDGKGNRAPQERNLKMHERGSEMTQADREFGTGMHTVDVPGADAGLHAGLKAQAAVADALAKNATPEGVDVTSRRVVIEHVKGQ